VSAGRVEVSFAEELDCVGLGNTMVLIELEVPWLSIGFLPSGAIVCPHHLQRSVARVDLNEKEPQEETATWDRASRQFDDRALRRLGRLLRTLQRLARSRPSGPMGRFTSARWDSRGTILKGVGPEGTEAKGLKSGAIEPVECGGGCVVSAGQAFRDTVGEARVVVGTLWGRLSTLKDVPTTEEHRGGAPFGCVLAEAVGSRSNGEGVFDERWGGRWGRQGCRTRYRRPRRCR
jgi:hypothetical protein